MLYVVITLDTNLPIKDIRSTARKADYSSLSLQTTKIKLFIITGSLLHSGH